MTIVRASRPLVLVAAVLALLAATLAVPPSGADAAQADPRAADHWTAARMANAIPRDLVVDRQGRGYLRRPDGVLEGHGHSERPRLRAVPTRQAEAAPPGGGGGGNDADGPAVSNLDPAAGTTIGSAHTFSATVTDASGVKSVSFVITYPDGSTGSFGASSVGGDRYEVRLEGFSDGDWMWHVVAKDRAKRGGNTTTTDRVPFTVDVAGGDPGDGGGGGDVVTNEPWSGGGTVQTAAGRVYFEMPSNGNNWGGYVCSGTVAREAATGHSVIITAAHCVYDDVNDVFARNVLFIPDQAGTTATGTDQACDNDPLGCWAPSHGVVDVEWTRRTFPDNIPWDYAYYVVPDSGAHAPGYTSGVSEVLADAAGTLPIQFTAPTQGAMTHALGYSASDDPNFMYCAEGLATEASYDDLWLSQCGLSGGASGGPWLQPVDGGDGPIVSVNSWGYTDQPGMGGPPLTTSASCVFDGALRGTTNADRGLVVTC